MTPGLVVIAVLLVQCNICTSDPQMTPCLVVIAVLLVQCNICTSDPQVTPGLVVIAVLLVQCNICTSDPQVTPGLGVIAVLLVLFVLVEPKRGHSEGQRTGKGVQGETGITAYLKDIWYCLTT